MSKHYLLLSTMNQLFLSLYEWLETTRTFSMQTMFVLAKKLNVSMSQMGALIKIHKIKMGNVSHIGSVLGITNPAASQMIDKLVDIGYVDRSEDPNDRRKKVIEISEKGNNILREAFSAQEDWLHKLADSFTSDEQEQIDSALKLLLNKFDELNLNSVD